MNNRNSDISNIVKQLHRAASSLERSDRRSRPTSNNNRNRYRSRSPVQYQRRQSRREEFSYDSEIPSPALTHPYEKYKANRAFGEMPFDGPAFNDAYASHANPEGTNFLTGPQNRALMRHSAYCKFLNFDIRTLEQRLVRVEQIIGDNLVLENRTKRIFDIKKQEQMDQSLPIIQLQTFSSQFENLSNQINNIQSVLKNCNLLEDRPRHTQSQFKDIENLHAEIQDIKAKLANFQSTQRQSVSKSGLSLTEKDMEVLAQLFDSIQKSNPEPKTILKTNTTLPPSAPNPSSSSPKKMLSVSFNERPSICTIENRYQNSTPTITATHSEPIKSPSAQGDAVKPTAPSKSND